MDAFSFPMLLNFSMQERNAEDIGAKWVIYVIPDGLGTQDMTPFLPNSVHMYESPISILGRGNELYSEIYF